MKSRFCPTEIDKRELSGLMKRAFIKTAQNNNSSRRANLETASFPSLFFLPFFFSPIAKIPFFEGTLITLSRTQKNLLPPFTSGSEDVPCLEPGPGPAVWVAPQQQPPVSVQAYSCQAVTVLQRFGVHSDFRHNRIRPVERGGAGPGPFVCLLVGCHVPTV